MSERVQIASVGRMSVYAAVAEHLRRAVQTGTLAEGTVLLEGPLAELFGSSRSPVKQALALLEQEGLLHPFEGRGLLVGRPDRPLRVPLTRDMIGLQETELASAKAPAWQSLWYEFERDIILRSVFGEGRINELALARHVGVGRTVARDLLIHAHDIGIIAKDRHGRWMVVPLDVRRFDNLYKLRMMLEPVALESAVPHIATDRLEVMAKRCEEAGVNYPDVSGASLDRMETDLHVECISACVNPELPRALWHSRCMLVAGKHIQAMVGSAANRIDPFMSEHLTVLKAILARNASAARDALHAHLESSRRKAANRLAAFHERHSAHDLDYVS